MDCKRYLDTPVSKPLHTSARRFTRLTACGFMLGCLISYHSLQTVRHTLSLHSSIPSNIYPDTEYPLRPATEPWNISASYEYPRSFNKEVTEGTWLRLTNHPFRREIVFDMLGDLYCMSTISSEDGKVTVAKPFLQGVPFDREAEFSPDGSTLVFISDDGFGVDNIWTIPYTTCDDMAEHSYNRATAVQQTNSTFRFFSSPAFHPTEAKLIATKWFLTGRPNGAGEIWEFPLLQKKCRNISERGGRKVIGRKLPASWPKEEYSHSQLGAEQGRYVGQHGDGIVFTRNVNDDLTGLFSYSKDVHKGINAVFLYNTTTGVTTKLVDAFPGGANMPRLSHDGNTLAYIKRVKEKSVLALKDMRSGTVHYIWGGLTWDVSPIPAFMGAYPNYGFSAHDASIIIWSQGQIWNISLSCNKLGERVATSKPSFLPFKASIDMQLGRTRYTETDIRGEELKDTGRVHALRGLSSDFGGNQVVFEAAGDTYIYNVQTKHQQLMGKLQPDQQCYQPSFVEETMVIHACWSSRDLTSFVLFDSSNDRTFPVEGLPRGRYVSPIVKHGKIAFVRIGKDAVLGDVEETAGEGVWLGNIVLPNPGSSVGKISNLHMIDTSMSLTGQDIRLEFKSAGNTEVLLIREPARIVQYDILEKSLRVVVSGKTAVEMAISEAMVENPLHQSWSGAESSSRNKRGPAIVLHDFQHIWLSKLEEGHAFNIWSKPGDIDTPISLTRLSDHGGREISFSGNGKKVFWLSGPLLQHVEVQTVLNRCADANPESRDTGSCVRADVQSHEIFAEYETDWSRMKKEARNQTVAIVNASIYTMDDVVERVIRNGTVVIENGVIKDIGHGDYVTTLKDSKIIDAEGGAVLPGFVDVHAHWRGMMTQFPAVSWEQETFLGYGVTTIHNPSSRIPGGYVERALVEKGAFYGPRIYHTGEVLYGSTQPSAYTEIRSLQDARDALMRVKVEGGKSSFSVKNYQQSSRAARQRILLAAEELDMLVVPEGGWSFDWGLTYFIDGFTSHEHPLPIPELYDDVLSLIAASGSSYTPLAVMNYGGIFGQHWIHQNNDVAEDAKLRKYVQHDYLTKLIEVKKAPDYSYQFFNSSISARKLVGRGVRSNIGSHGEMPIGYLYHSEMYMSSLGGLLPYDVLHAATIGGATSLGLQAAVGSLEPGKLADLVIYPPGVDSIDTVWANSMHMKYVVRGGRIFNVDDGLEEVWPRAGRRMERPRINIEIEN